MHSCLLGHSCQVTGSRALAGAVRDDDLRLRLHQRLQPHQLDMRNRLATYAAACLDRCRAFRGWHLFLVQTVPEQHTCDPAELLIRMLFKFILPNASVLTCVLSRVGARRRSMFGEGWL